MNLTAGIVVAVIGLVFALLSMFDIVPGITSTGIYLILLGGLICGLSFIKKPDENETPRISTSETLANIFFSPVEVFQNLRRHPRWLVALLIMSVMSGVYTNLFLYRLTPERVTNFVIDKTLESPLFAGNEEARRQIEAGRAEAIKQNTNPLIRIAQVVNGFIGKIFLYAFLAAVFLLVILAMGGSINYWQAFSAAVYASFPVEVLRFVLNTIILFIKDPTDIHPILGQSALIQDNLGFLVSPSVSPVIFTLLSSIGILMFYWVWLNAVGLKNAGEKVSSTAAWSATIIIYLVFVAFGAVTSYFFSGFIT
jgi:hypothetical protein